MNNEIVEPYYVEIKDLGTFPPFPFPSICGDNVPEGWELIDIYFVDSPGFGIEEELALTVDAFVEVIEAGFGYAIVNEGQFQVYIGKYRKI